MCPVSYPPFVEQGTLQRQHLIVYFRARLDPIHHPTFPCFDRAFPNSIRLQREEVDMATWITRSRVLQVFTDLESINEPLLCLRVLRHLSTKYMCSIKMYSDDTHEVVERPHASLVTTKAELVKFGASEGVSLGTLFALWAHGQLRAKL